MALNPKWKSGFAIASTLVLIGATAMFADAHNWSRDQFGGACVVILVAGLIAIRSLRGESQEMLRAEWEASLSKFRDHMGNLVAHFGSALQTTSNDALPSGTTWDDVASRSRWPDLGEDPIQGWASRKAVWMNDNERLTLRAARWIDGVERNTKPFHKARRQIGTALVKWMVWERDLIIGPLIAPVIAEHRDSIVMWAFIEIATADRVQMDSPPPEWRKLPELWPVLANPRRSGS